MNVRDALSFSQELAKVISAIHQPNGMTIDPRCISCDQEYPCLTQQNAASIQMISVAASRESRHSMPIPVSAHGRSG